MGVILRLAPQEIAMHNVPEQKKYGINYFGKKKGTRDRVKGTEFIYATDFS